MRECLRKVAQHLLLYRIVFFAHQAQVVAELEQTFEQTLRIVYAAELMKADNHPEAAG